MPDSATEPRKMVAVRLWYSDDKGTVTIRDLGPSDLADASTALTSWVQLPDTGIQAVTIYWNETYLIWKGDGQVREHYVSLFSGCDYYFGSLDGRFGAGTAEDVPEGLPTVPGLVKRGSYMPDDAFFALYQGIKENRSAPQS